MGGPGVCCLSGSATWVGCCRLGTTVVGTLQLVLGSKDPESMGFLSYVVLFDIYGLST